MLNEASEAELGVKTSPCTDICDTPEGQMLVGGGFPDSSNAEADGEEPPGSLRHVGVMTGTQTALRTGTVNKQLSFAAHVFIVLLTALQSS